MLLKHLLIGYLFATLTALAVALSGAGLWASLGAYSLSGLCGTITSALFTILPHQTPVRTRSASYRM